MTKHNSEHGSLRAYIIGFLLSLLFTFVPYGLVVTGSISGTALLVTILAFAFLQMLVQIIFFLHIGRGPKARWYYFFFVATAATILVVVGGSIIIIKNLHYGMDTTSQVKKLANDEGIYQIGGELTGACEGQHTNQRVVIKNFAVTPNITNARMCDTLTFINEDDDTKVLTFGEHPQHEAYAGEEEYIIRPGKAKTITLSEAGTYRFHDHLNPDTFGYFSVKPSN